MPHTLLLVDDEENILRALRRLFQRAGHELLTATCGEEALSVLRERTVSLVISDQRMPGMTGAELLTQVRRLQPDAVRIMLTGYSDIQAATEAINDGQVYRFLPKPWDDQALLAVVEQALEDLDLRKEHAALQAQVSRQNAELRNLNERLEAKVRERTKELERVLQLSGGLNETLRRRNVATIKAFAGLLDLSSAAVGAHCRRVAALVPPICAKLHIRDQQLIQEMVIAALLHDIGKIALPDAILGKEQAHLSQEEREEVMKHPVVGEARIKLVEGLEDVSRMIRHHHENADGSGYPDRLVGGDIPLGARILRVLDTYDQLSRGGTRKVAEGRMVIEALHQQVGRAYDRPLYAALLEVIEAPSAEPPQAEERPDAEASASAGTCTQPEAESPSVFTEVPKKRRYIFVPPKFNTVNEMKIPLEKLEVGMVLSRELITDDGTLLVARNEPIKPSYLERIDTLSQSFSISPFAYVYRERKKRPGL